MGELYQSLAEKAREIRYSTMEMLGNLGVGHVGGSLSVVDALVVLYYKHMQIDPRNPQKADRDRFVLSKGHAGPALYAVLADKGYFPKEMLDTLNRPGTRLPSHADMQRTPGIDMTTGALGQGLSCALGIAAGSKLKQDGAFVYAMIGDGESQEGQIWEAAMYAAQLGLDNLIVMTDFNGLQIDGTVAEVNGLEPLDKKWEAFGWDVAVVDGHDLEAIDLAITHAKASSGKPSMIILKTRKGKGVSFVEAALTANHNMPLSAEQTEQALRELSEGGEPV